MTDTLGAVKKSLAVVVIGVTLALAGACFEQFAFASPVTLPVVRLPGNPVICFDLDPKASEVACFQRETVLDALSFKNTGSCCRWDIPRPLEAK